MPDEPARGEAGPDFAELDGAAAVELLARHAARLSAITDAFFESLLAALDEGKTPAAAGATAVALAETMVVAAAADLAAGLALAAAATAHGLRSAPQ